MAGRIQPLPIVVALSALLSVSVAGASGGWHLLRLRDALRSAAFVLVVKKASPAVETRDVQLPYRNSGRSQVAKLPTRFRRFEVVEVLRAEPKRGNRASAARYLTPGREHTVDLLEASAAGSTVRLLSTQDISNHKRQVRFLASGTRTIVMEHRLEHGATAEQLEAEQQFVLLARYEPSYEAFVGMAGVGLVPLTSRAQVERLLMEPEPRP